MIGAKSGVMRDVPDGGKVFGIPAVPDRQAKRQIVATQHLPDMIRRLRELEKAVETLQARAVV
jgi:UDP-3-O-[3-hydroxymyristoyl] glucosamine N-acyltransferase